ncbi:unknown protein [Microcystis aeruginosa NIES-843]|uniref:Transposase n=1 Tax=Microcystis aeruginosa (strain NIES-843 / IAM M-2473) TaxID=449447 RepID=B0JKX8_MICAN|nr:unknown protein [Microcystis aeruginosa NIES-843]
MEPRDRSAIIAGRRFQSLIGFKINWNDRELGKQAKVDHKFQSLIGFKINWNNQAGS